MQEGATKPTAAAPERAVPLTWRSYCRNYRSQSTAHCFNVQTASLAGAGAAQAGVCSSPPSPGFVGKGGDMKATPPPPVIVLRLLALGP